MRIFKRFFILSLITAFVVMLVTQMLLKNSAVKNKLSRLYEIESQYVYSEQEISDGYIVIRVSNPSDNLFILQNGEKTDVLNSEIMRIDILDNSVIEIDGRNTEEQFTVELTETSENIEGFYENSIKINSNIVILGRFFIK